MKISEHEKQIHKEEFTHGFDEAHIQFKSQHDKMIQHTLADIFDHRSGVMNNMLRLLHLVTLLEFKMNVNTESQLKHPNPPLLPKQI